MLGMLEAVALAMIFGHEKEENAFILEYAFS